MFEIKKIDKNIIILAFIAVAGLIITIFAFYPGLYYGDVQRHVKAAETFLYDTAHPPIVAIVWSFILSFYHNYGLVFITQMFFYWLAFFIISKKAFDNGFNILSYLVIAIPFLPFIINMSGVMGKDTFIAIYLLLSFAIYMTDINKPLKISLSLILLLTALLARVNVFFAAFPIILFFIYGNLDLKKIKLYKYFIIIVAFGLFTIGFTKTFNKIWGVIDVHVEISLFLFDIGGISKYENKVLFPEEFLVDKDGKAVPHEKVLGCYDHRFSDVWTSWAYVRTAQDDCDFIYKYSLKSLAKRTYKLREVWLQSILKYPLAYIIHRVSYFNFYLFSPASTSYYYTEMKNIYDPEKGWEFGRDAMGIAPWEDDINNEPVLINGIAEFLGNIIHFMDKTFLFKPYFYLLINIFILVYLINTGSWVMSLKFYNITLFLCLSSLSFFMAYLIIGITDHFRYIYWSQVSSVVALAFTIGNFCYSPSKARDYVILAYDKFSYYLKKIVY